MSENNNEKQALKDLLTGEGQNDQNPQNVMHSEVDAQDQPVEESTKEKPELHNDVGTDVNKFLNRRAKSSMGATGKDSSIQIQKSNDVKDIITRVEARNPTSPVEPKAGFGNIKVAKITDPSKKKDRYNRRKQKTIDRFTSSQVVAAQSGYWAIVSGLTTAETMNIQEPIGNDTYTQRRNMYMEIWKKIVNTSAGTLSFEDFLRYTTMADEQTLFFGLFNATHPNENVYPVPCNSVKCKGKPFNVSKKNDELIMEIADETVDRVIDIVNNPRSREVYFLNNDFTRKADRCVFKNGELIIDTCVPTLEHFLEKLANRVDSSLATEYRNVISLVPFISRVLIFDDFDSEEEPQYIEFRPENAEDAPIILSEIASLNDVEFATLAETVEKDQEKYIIKFGIKECTCPECGKKYTDVPVKFDDMLFIKLQQTMMEKTNE